MYKVVFTINRCSGHSALKDELEKMGASFEMIDSTSNGFYSKEFRIKKFTGKGSSAKNKKLFSLIYS